MTPADQLLDAYSRIHEEVMGVLDGISADDLGARLDAEANSIAWLIWHLTRVQDDHMAQAFGVDQVWITQDWVTRFGLPFPVGDHGYGHSSADVGELSGISRELLEGYFEATWAQTKDLLSVVTAQDLDRIVDTRWTPAVTLGVRLTSVLSDDLQHVGQAAFIRGVLERR